MSPRCARAVREHEAAFERLVCSFDCDRPSFDELMAAIDACNVALAAVVAVQAVEEAQARAWALVLFDQAFW